MRISERDALRELAAQHAALRDQIARCEELADELDAGRIEAAQLLAAVSELRLAFDAHNRFEERLLRPILLDRGPGALRALRVARMARDHTEEHRAMRRGLEPTTSSQLRDALDSLSAHLDAEERSFVTPKILRDDAAR